MLTLTDVTVTYPDGDRTLTALDRASLTAAPGTTTAIVGPSGSGKSTLLAVVAGLVVPTSGTVEIDGQCLDGLPDDARATVRRNEIGIVFQQPNLLPSLTAVEQLLVMDHLRGARPDRARALRLLDRVGLADRAGRRPHELSGGQRQRVGIARALMASPSVLLADEPTSALDTERARSVIDLLGEVTREGDLATLVVTHDRDLANLADAQVEVRDGRLRAHAPTPSPAMPAVDRPAAPALA